MTTSLDDLFVTDSTPTLRLLSLGAGVQSTTLALLAAEGALPALDAAVFADTGWEPAAVYTHLDRLTEHLAAADPPIPVHRVTYRNIRQDTFDNYNRLPLFMRGPDGSLGMLQRQCTEQYKLKPLKREVRRLLGAKTSSTGAVLRPPAGAVAEQWIGFSTDEIGRVSDRERDPYITTRYPLLELGMSRKDCLAWLDARGWETTPKSACIGCPFHGNRMWRTMRDEHPDEFADAVAFDHAIRNHKEHFRGEGFLHRSRLPLDEAPIDRRSPAEWAELQGDLFADLPDEVRETVEVIEEGDPDGCSPFGCRSGEALG